MTLDELLQSRTPDEVLETILQSLASKDFPITSWVEGDPARTMLEVDAAALADVSSSIPAIVKGGFLSTSSGDWLTLLASEIYDEERLPALTTRGKLDLAAVAAAGPYTIIPGQLIVSNGADLRYRNTTGGVLAQGGTLQVTIEAESPGQVYNVGAGAITTLHTSLAGVSVTNPSGWITRAGVDAELDPSLQERCRDKWATLGGGATASVYRYWARKASNAVSRAQVQGATGTGTVTVTVAGPGGPVGETARSAVETYIRDRLPLTCAIEVEDVTIVPVPLVGALYVQSGLHSTALATVQASLDAYVQDLPVGGYPLGVSSATGVDRALIIEKLREVAGCVNVVLTTPEADVELSANELPQFDYGGLAVVEV
jgi:uncharacterized phage protein gp47/JayE